MQLHSLDDLKLLAQGSGATGEGLYSSVYAMPVPNLVLKVGRSLTDGWLAYAAWCMTHPDPEPWMPRIHTLHVDVNAREVYAVMERLEPIEHRNAPDVVSSVRMIRDGSRPTTVAIDILRAVADGMGLSDNEWVDAHDHNWMMRGDELVLTDPLACLYGFCVLGYVRSRVGTNITVEG